MEELIQTIIDRIVEHITSNTDASDQVINDVIDKVNESVTSYMENPDDNIQDGIQNIINSINEGAAQLTNLSFGSNHGYLIDPHISFSDLFQDTPTEAVEVDSSFFNTEGLNDTDKSDIPFVGHSQEEINNNKAKAEIEISRQKSNIEQHKRMIEMRSKDGLPSNLEQSHLNDAQAALRKARDEYNKWSNMKPNPSN